MKGEKCENEDLSNLTFPLLVTPKLDGIRSVKQGIALSTTFKPIPNLHIQRLMKDLPDGLDGELILEGAPFNEISSAVMSMDGSPDFAYYVFDYVSDSLSRPYAERIAQLIALKLPSFCKLVLPVQIDSLEELLLHERAILLEGYEGVMLRSPYGKYKCGKSTVKQGLLMKRKPMEDSECEVFGFEEQLENLNEKTLDNFGNSKRSSHQDNKVPAGTLGKFLVREIGNTPWKGQEFAIGTGVGLTHELRKEIWNNRETYLGKVIVYKYQSIGTKDLPRLPIYKGFRHRDDISG